MGKVTYVILSYGRQDLLMKCLTSFRKFHADDPVIVTDNGGPNMELTQKTCDIFGAKLLVNPLNDSLSKLMNMGCDVAETPYVCIVTNGVEFTTRLTEQFEKDFNLHPDIAVVGGLLMYSDGRIQHGGGRRFWPYHQMGHYGQGKYPYQAKMCTQTAYRLYVTGATAAIRKSFWETTKYDETLTMSCEDTDICFKAWNSGKRVYYDPLITSIHNEGSTRGRTPEEKQRNAPWAFEKEKKSLEIFKARYNDADIHEMDKKVNRLNAELHPELPKAFIRHGAIGDVLRCLEVYDELVKIHGPMVVITGVPEAFKDRQVVAITKSVDEFQVSGIIDLDLAYERDRTKGIVEMYAKAAGVKLLDTSIKPVELAHSEYDWMALREALPEYDWSKPYIVVHMGQGWPGKNIPVALWKILVLSLRQRGHNIICVGAGHDISPEGDGIYSLVNKTTIHSLRALCLDAKLFIGIDSAPLHIADGCCPAIGLFTVCNPKNLVSDEVTAFETEAECKRCLERQSLTTMYKCDFENGDPRQFRCGQMFDPKAILDKAFELMEKKK